jgi:RHS repeat-associated protein
MNYSLTRLLAYSLNLAVFFCLTSLSLFSQNSITPPTINREFTPNTPEASAFNKYGDIGVNLFTGSPNISFPIKASEEIPISISYNASGVKPEEHHGWVGTNWNLNVGGMITRIKRNAIDESKDFDFTNNKPYIENNWRLKDKSPNWYDEAVNAKVSNIVLLPPTTDTAKLNTFLSDLEPDEFVFNFGDFSGSFLLNHDGEWVFRANNPSEFKMKAVDIRTNDNGNLMFFKVTNTLSIPYPRMIMGFTILTSDGTEYTFGGDESSIDFSYSFGETETMKRHRSLFAMGWHLKKIKHVSGKVIDYVYEKDHFTVVVNKARSLIGISMKSNSSNTVQAEGSGGINRNYNILRSSYLREIQTPYETIKFDREQVIGLADYDFQASDIANFASSHNVDMYQRKWFKLTAIKTYNKNATPLLLRQFNFEYDVSNSNRLQLKNVKQVDVDNTVSTIPIVDFEYNLAELPPYGSGKIDAWGYYNNKGMFDATITTPSGTNSNSVEQNYKSVREAHPINCQAEVLNSIKYPTGGSTTLEYEIHDYSLAYTKIASSSIDGYAGGLRIRKMKHSDGVNTYNDVEKTYKYLKNYPNSPTTSASTGVLASSPNFYDLITQDLVLHNITIFGFAAMDEQSLNPINLTSGSPVTYSEVVEVNKDNSYTIHKFSNFGVEHNSKPYDNFGAIQTKKNNTLLINLINPLKDPIIDNGDMRGKLLEQRFFDNNNNIQKKVENIYTLSAGVTKAIRVVTVNATKVVCCGGLEDGEQRASAYYILTAPIFLEKSTTTDYYFSPSAQVTILTENFYDSRKNMTQQKVTHLNNTEIKSNITTDYSYAYDKNITTSLVVNPNVSESTDALGHKQAMINAFMIGVPLETKNNFNKGSKIEFKTFNNGTISTAVLPYIFYSQNKLGTFTEQFRINSYSNYDKPTQTKSKGNYQNSANITTITDYAWSNGLLQSKTFGDLKWAFTYDLNKRFLTEKADENGLKQQFTYDGYRRLKKIDDRYKSGDVAGTVQATMEYDYKYQNIAGGIPYSFVETKTWYRGVTNTTPNTDKMVNKQFVDGLGRPLSIVKEYYTPNQQHLKSYVLYDNLGRQDKVYQPIERSQLGVDPNLSLLLNGRPYVQTQYEASPLSRPLRQIMEDGRTIETAYATNSLDEVRAFTVTLGRVSNDQLVTVVPNGNYAANTLFKTIVWDENGTTNQTTLVGRNVGRTEIFKDKLDRVVLTRKFVKNVGGSFVKVDTYNIYDEYGNLVMVIPPDAVSTTVNYSLVFQYNYDNLYRLVEKKVPGAKYVRFYYNDRDLMVLMQDGNMRNASYGGTSNTGVGSGFARKYLATVYDKMGRPIKTGFTSNSFSALTLGQNFEVTDAHISTRLTSTIFFRRDDNGTINPSGLLATNWANHQESKVLKNTTIPTVREYIWSYMERRPGIEYMGNPVWTGKQHLLCTTKRYGWMDVGDAPCDDNDYDGMDWSVSAYNGAQMPLYSNHYTFSTNYAQQIRTSDYMTYDHALRTTKLDHAFSMGGASIPSPTNICNMVYNFKNQLIEKNLGYNSTYNKYLQSIDYEYNVRGWLTKINQLNLGGSGQPQFQIMTPQSPSPGTIQNLAISPFINKMMHDAVIPYRNAEEGTMTAINDDNTDLYSQVINYDNPDTRFGNPSPQYNGNISNTFWQVAGRAVQGYGFKYDDLNRLTEGNYYDVTYGITSTPIFEAGKFTEKILEYDLRGNIKKLQRFGFKEASINANNDVVGNYGEIDNLTYNYDPANANRIQTITDGTTAAHLTKGFKYNNATNSAYQYDDNGNMIYDPNKGLTIAYNYLNLPETITMPSGDGHTGVIQFVYDASGQKHRRIVKKLISGTSSVITTDLKITDYVGGYEYEVVNNNTSNGMVLSHTNSLPSRIHHAEGAITKEANSTTYQYEFALRDHLGNTRVTFKDKNGDAVTDYWSSNQTTNEIAQINHYYPFGLNMEGNWNGANGANKYQFGGKELNDDFGLGLSDFGARMYDPAVSRWNAPDPLAEKFMQWSPYNYGVNNPILFTDPDGREIRVFFGTDVNQYVVFSYDEDGNGKFTNSDGSAYDGKNNFLNNAMTAFNALSESQTGRDVISNLASAPAEEMTLKIKQAVDNGGVFSFAPVDNKNTGQIPWNPKSGAQDGATGNKQNPAMVLFHEMDHANEAYEKSKVDKITPADAHAKISGTKAGYDAEEKRVITGKEAQVARDLNPKYPNSGFQEFKSHHGKFIPTTGPTNVTPPKSKQKRN